MEQVGREREDGKADFKSDQVHIGAAKQTHLAREVFSCPPACGPIVLVSTDLGLQGNEDGTDYAKKLEYYGKDIMLYMQFGPPAPTDAKPINFRRESTRSGVYPSSPSSSSFACRYARTGNRDK